jgi:CHAT domain-containing protein
VTLDWLERQMSGADILHISAHGIFDPKEPANSGLMLASAHSLADSEFGVLDLGHDGSPAGASRDGIVIRLWTLRRLWQRSSLSHCRLAFLAGCETSTVHWQDAIDAFVALPSGFLQGGAATVIGSSWEVQDLATMLSTQYFYNHLFEGNWRPAATLANAQLWISSLTVRQMMEVKETADLLSDWYTLKNGNAQPTRDKVIRSAFGAAQDLDRAPFSSPLYWAPLRCVGLP